MCGTTCVDLTNDLGNCGNCGVSCSAASPSTATCTNARCIVTLASSGGYGSGIAVDSTSVYWANEDSVLKIPLGGGNITTLVANAGQSFQIAINSSNLYWTSFLGSLGRVGLDGSNATTLVSNESINPPYFVALDGSNVYWTNQTDNTTGTIQSQALAVPGTTSTLVSGQSLSSGIAVVSGTLYWADEGGAAAASGSVMTSTTTGASQAVFASGQNAYAIAVDSTNVYWTIPNSPAAVVKAPQANSGGGPVTLASGLGEPTGIAVDSEYVYWVDENASNVMKVAIGGGSPVTVANLLGPQFLAVDATSIYCTTSSPSGNVFKITPK